MEATLRDVVLDLVQILDEAADSGRLFGGEAITIEKIDTDAYFNGHADKILLTLSNGEKVDIRATWA